MARQATAMLGFVKPWVLAQLRLLASRLGFRSLPSMLTGLAWAHKLRPEATERAVAALTGREGLTLGEPPDDGQGKP